MPEDQKLFVPVGSERSCSYPCHPLSTMESAHPRTSFSPSPLTCECDINPLQAHMQTKMGSDARSTESLVGCVDAHPTH